MNNERNPKFSCSALDIIGMIFTPLGLVFILVGGIITAFAENHPENTTGDPRLFFWLFGGIGSIFLILGIIFLLLMLRRRSLHRQLFAEGHYVMATVTSVMPNYNVRINGRTPYTCLLYTSPSPRD